MASFFKAAIFGLSSISFAPAPESYPVPTSDSKAVYAEKTFTTFDGLTLHGHLASPRQAKGKMPVVLLLVGSGGGNRYENVPGEVTSTGQPALLFKSIEDVLIDRGLAVFTYDKRGVIPTNDTFLESTLTSDFQSATAQNLAKDAVSAFDLVSSLPEIDRNKISVLGHSEGTILALKVAEGRPQTHALLLLGLFTRGFEELSYYQSVVANLRIMGLMSGSGDGYLDAQEVSAFHKIAANEIPDWSGMLSAMDFTKDGKISLSEQQFYFEQAARDFLKSISDIQSPWGLSMPRDWFRQYLSEGAFLQRFTAFCQKINVIHGEADMQTPFADALELQVACLESKHPLQSFSSFPDLGHGFSPRISLKGWKDTIGPIDVSVLQKIGAVAEAATR